MTLKIYGLGISAGTRLALAACAEKNVPAELVGLDYMGGELKGAAHVARQPFAKVPALDHDGFALFESRAIARYVAETFPGASLIPTDPKERALMDQWLNVEQHEFYPTAHPLALELWLKPLFGMGDPDPAIVERLRGATSIVLEVLDKALAGKTYLVGNQFTLADLVYMPDLENLHTAGQAAWLGRYENVTRWWKTISSRPAWVAVKAQVSA